MAMFTLLVTTEAKDEYEGGAGREPTHAELAAHMQDVLNDYTKHNYELPWRVMQVRASSS